MAPQSVRRRNLGFVLLLLLGLGLAFGPSPSQVAGTGGGGLALAASPAPAGPPSPLYFARVYIDGERPALPKPAVLAGGRLYAPARAAFEKLGALVHWDGTKVIIKVVGPTGEETKVNLWLGRGEAAVNGTMVQLDTPAFMWDGTVMAPVKFVADTMGLDSIWDGERRSLYLAHDLDGEGQGETGQGAPGGGGASAPAVPAGLVPPQITLAFAGDTLLGSRIGDLIKANGTDYPWGGVAPTLSRADLAMVNLECSVSTRGSPMPDKQYTFRAAPESLIGLRNAGVDIVSIANNHALDFGQDAFLDTVAYLDQYGVRHVGGGANSTEAIRPVILEAGGFRIGYLGATGIYPVSGWIASASRPGMVATHNQSAFMKAVSDLSREVDYVVVGVHWGVERDRLPSDYQRQYGKALVEAGADLIIGHHPHVLQGMQVYKGSLIAYSLGNFIFTYSTRTSMDSGILLVTLDKQGIAAVQFLPAYTGTAGRPTLEDGADYGRILGEMNHYSETWKTLFDPLGYILLP